jgi:acyl-CoA thioesterase
VTSQFDQDTEISPDGDVTITGRWDGISGIPNGGYQLAICLRALARLMPYPDPVVVSGFFLRPGKLGPARVSASLLRAGRRMAFGEANLVQDGKETVRATAAFTTLGDHDEPLFLGATRPLLPPPDDCVGAPPGAEGLPAIARQVDLRTAEPPGWMRGEPGGNPNMEFWLRFADGRDADLICLPLIVDAAPPAVLDLGALSTTVELTVCLRAKPVPGWLACRATTRCVASGYHEEDFEIWDSAGTLVAQSRQLCMIVE